MHANCVVIYTSRCDDIQCVALMIYNAGVDCDAFPGGEGGPFVVDEGNRYAPNNAGEDQYNLRLMICTQIAW